MRKRSSRMLLIALCILLLAVIPGVHAHELVVESSKAVYQLGDTINITAVVRNTKDETVDLIVEAVLQDMEGKVTPFPVQYPLTLNSNENRTVQLFTLTVDERFYSGTYVVDVSVIEGRFRVYEEEISFAIEGAPEDMDVAVLLSKDVSYTTQSRVFIKNDWIYMGISCSVENVSITAHLIFPDNSSKLLFLPSTLVAGQIGAYTLLVEASAEGYRNVSLTDYFAVLEHAPFSDGEIETTIEIPEVPWTMIVGIVIAIVVIAIVVYLYKKGYF